LAGNLDLYLLRHGEAGKSLAAAATDSKRSLTEDGRKEVKRVAASLGVLGIHFDRIVSSPLSRAAETANLVAATTNPRVRVELWDELKPEGDPKRLWARLAGLGRESTVLIVGHEPYLSSLIAGIIDAKSARLVLKKAGLARVNVAVLGPDIKGELRWLLSPRIMKRIA
jgi:phosphohistidine phosphatase